MDSCQVKVVYVLDSHARVEISFAWLPLKMKVFVVELPFVIYIGLYTLNFVFINGDLLHIILKKKRECEAGANSWLGFQLNGATKLHDNLPGYY